MVRWFWENLSSLLLALILGLIVWVAAMLNADPTDTRELGVAIPIEYIGLREGLMIVGEPPPQTGRVTLRAPSSVWELIGQEQVHLQVRLDGLQEGSHRLEVEPSVDVRPAIVDEYDPHAVTITLERAATTSMPVRVVALGEPQLGYRAASVSASPDQVIVLGPLSLVDRVDEIRASVNVNDALQNFDRQVTLVAVDGEGNEIDGLQLDPEAVLVSVQIEPRESFRLVSVIPRLAGEEQLVEAGYQINDVIVDPSVVTVFSADPEALEALPGFVETIPLDISGATSDVERRLAVDLPEGISLVEEQSVLVRVSVSAIVRTLTVTREVQVRNLDPRLYIQLSPETVSIILSGPLPVLNSLDTEDVRVIVDLLDLGPGTHQVAPSVIIAPTNIEQESIFPTVIEIIISATPLPTPSPNP